MKLRTPFESDGDKAEFSARLAIVFAVVGCVLGVLLWPTLKELFAISSSDDRYIQILAAPFICLFLIYWDRKDIFSVSEDSTRVAIPLFSLAVLVCLISTLVHLGGSGIGRLVFPAFALILLFHSAFFLCFGLHSWMRAVYPLSCLFLTIPIPTAGMDWLITGFQHGSAASSGAILDFIGVSALRNGTTFSIPGLDFNIAPECSGIRSGVAFLLVGILASRLYLRSPLGRLSLILATVPITIFKNSIRIVVTTVLGAYVNRAFIDGPFHHRYGGFIFAPVDFLLFVPLLLLVQKLERRLSDDKGYQVPVVAALN